MSEPLDPQKQPLVPVRTTTDGWHIATVHYSKVPNFDFQAACVGMGDDEIQRELEIAWNVTAGKRVYPQFSRERHESTEDLPFDPEKTLLCGIDCPGTPAFVVSQLNAYGQWLIYPSISPDDDEFKGFYDFAEVCADHLQRNYATPYGLSLSDLRIVLVGDPAGQYAAPTTKGDRQEKRTCFEILRSGVEVFLGEDDEGRPITANKPGWGWNVIPGEVSLGKRIEAVRARLRSLIGDGLPAIVVDHRAEFIISSFLGGYCYELYSDGTYSKDPLKNHASHSMNALEYIATRIWAQCYRPEDEDEDRPKRQPFRSQAASRYS